MNKQQFRSAKSWNFEDFPSRLLIFQGFHFFPDRVLTHGFQRLPERAQGSAKDLAGSPPGADRAARRAAGWRRCFFFRMAVVIRKRMGYELLIVI